MIVLELLIHLNDVSTDLVNVPKFVSAIEKFPKVDYSYELKSIGRQKRLYPSLSSLSLNLPQSQAFAKALVLAKQQKDWCVHSIQEYSFRFEGTATTPLLGFVDDFVIEVRPDPANKSKSLIVMRSKSRLGSSDLGANAKRIRTYFESFPVEGR